MTIIANDNRDFNESGDRSERKDIDVCAEFAAFGVSRGTLSATEFAELLEKTGAPLIGVTGRRHIVPEALTAVESAARTAARALVAAAEEDGRPIYVATGLAIGADQLAAKMVLEARTGAAARGEASPLRLVALLPMSVAEYRRDFSTKPGTGETASASELDDFNRYLASADWVVEIEPTAANVERAKRGEEPDRMAQYAALGDFLVERSRLLWAFWSGDASNAKPGGTTDVVLRKTRRLANVGDAGELKAAEAVCCVATPEVLRVKNPDGTKTRVPESTENAGKLAFWTSPSADVPTFETPEIVASGLKCFWQTK
ncbi:MAG: hypothetical protein IIW01_05315 [Thermoguttaceae bacterium]|nr:hypothetical protein [Thermoguttaceae bacterium]